MPKWEIHDKWAQKKGLSQEVSNYVNQLSDFPEQSHEFIQFCEHEGVEIVLQLVTAHDFKLIMNIPKYLQVEFMRRKGSGFVTAWYLHYVLDYIKMAPALTLEDVISRTRGKFGTCHELEAINDFVLDHAEEILHDCR